MGIRVLRTDITRIKADVIVNSANQDPLYGNGVDRAIYMAAGEKDLLAARRSIGEIEPGEVRETHAYGLNAKWIFHAVAPRWIDGKSGEYEILANCYKNSFKLAGEKKCNSIAFPLISTGVYGFPRKIALQIAVNEIIAHVLNNDINVYLVLFDKETVELSKRIWPEICEELSDKDVALISQNEYVDSNDFLEHMLKPLNMIEVGNIDPVVQKYYDGIKTVFMQVINKNVEETFGQRVLKYMEESYKKDSDFYKAAGISNKTFYRLRDDCEKPFHPSKETVWGVCLALKLDKYKATQLMNLAKYEIDMQDPKDCELLYCLNNRIYDLNDVNIRLDDKGLPLVSERK